MGKFLKEAVAMTSRFKPGDRAYFVGNGRFLHEVTVVKVAGGFATLLFNDRSGGVKLRENRLFKSKEEAERSMQGRNKRG